MLGIYTNNYSIIAQNNLTAANSGIAKSIERLSSGLRINSAADDASGLGISEKLRAQIRGLSQADRNAQDAVSFLQTAEGGMEVIGSMLHRMRELAVQAGNGTYTSNDRQQLQKEVDQLKSEINRIAASTEYNTKKLLTGDSAALWSSSNAGVEAIVRGAPAEGNYRLEISTDPALNAVYKSDIMMSSGSQGATSLSARAASINVNIDCAGPIVAAELVSGNVLGEAFKATVMGVSANASVSNSVAKSGITTHSMAGFAADYNGNATGVSMVSTGNATYSGYIVAEIKGDYKKDTVNGEVKVAFTFISASSGATTTVEKMVKVGEAFEMTAGSTGGMFGAGDAFSFTLSNQDYKAGSKIAYNVQDTLAAPGIKMESDNYGSVVRSAGGTLYALKNVAVGEQTTLASFKLQTGAALTAADQGRFNTLTVVEGPASTNISVKHLAGEAGVYEAQVRTGGATAGLAMHSRFVHFTGTGTLGFSTDAAAVGNIQVAVSGAYTSTGYLVLEVIEGKANMSAAATTQSFKVMATWIDAQTGIKTEQEITVMSGAGTNATSFSLGGNKFVLNTGAFVGGTTVGDTFAITVQAAVTNDLTVRAGSPGYTTASATAGSQFPINSAAASVAIVAGQTSNVFSLADLNMTSGAIKTTGFSITGSNNLSAGRDTILVTASGGNTAAGLATLDTRLGTIQNFVNADGRNVLENTQTLTIYGNNGQTEIYLEGCDTVEDMKNKLTNALISLGMGATAASAGSQAEADKINANLVQFVTEENKSQFGPAAVAGTLVIQSALMGANSEINFAGDENLINALGLATIQHATKPQTTVNVFNAHTNEFIGGDTVCDGILRGVIKGIDVKVDDTMGVTARWDATKGGVVFDSREVANTAYLHIVDNRTTVQIGANEGQTFDISIGAMDTRALEIDNVFVTTFEKSQKAITTLDMAMERLNSARATIGAQINRLEYTTQNLAVSRQNLIAGESRIRDLDIASASAEFARNQILVNASMAMLAQANQLPSMALQLIG